MKVLQINQTYRNGGSTGRIAYELLLTQQKAGFDGFVVYGYSDGEVLDERSLCLQKKQIGRKLNILRTRLFDKHGFYNEYETRILLRYIEALRPDIIHLHNIHNHYVHVGRLFEYIKEHNIPVVWTLHDCWSFTGHCAYFDYAHCDKWKTQCHDCPSLRDYPPTWFIDRTDKNYQLKRNTFTGVKNLSLVTPSRWLANLTRESFLKEYPVEIINNGVDTNVFHPTENNVKEQLGISGKKMLLAMASVFDHRKGTDYLLQLPQLLNDDEVLVLVGLGENQKKLFSHKRCICLGRTNSVGELAGFYSAADVLINPTLEDNFPTTHIEALACGTPVVTFKTGGSIESVLDGESFSSDNGITYSSVGAVVPKGDLKAMIGAARCIMTKGKTAYKEACRKKAEERYDKNKQYQKYIDLYSELYAKSVNS